MSLRERVSAAAEVDAFMSKKKAFSTYPREDLIELYADAFMKGYMQCAEKIREWRKEIEAERDAALAASRRWKALAKLLHADEIHYHYVEPCGQKVRAVASHSAKLALQLARATEVVDAAIRIRNSGYDGPFIGEVCSDLFESIAAYERAKLGK